MRVLHIGWGFSPWRGGGLIEYAEDLMKIQTEKGFEVYYFCSGRYFPLFKKIKLLKWKKDNVNVFEVVNSPIYHGGDLGSSQPKLDMDEPQIESFFRKVLDEIRPEIIHIQELAGLPSSLIEIAKNEYEIPVIMTLHDYFLLCPTLKLLDHQQNFCYHTNLDYNCSVCCQNAPTAKRDLVKSEIINFLNRHKLLQWVLILFSTLKNFENNIFRRNQVKGALVKPKSNIDYQKRREINLVRMRKTDLLIAQSHKVETIYKYFLKSNNILTINSTVFHLSSIKPKELEHFSYPISFGTLNGFSSVPKGSFLLERAIYLLNQRGLKNYFHFHIWGWLDPSYKYIVNLDNVTYHGLYELKDLDNNLESVSVGIIPSIWEEVYGYVGLEFLAKGIPIIGNKKGGIVDYAIENFTGWLNKSSSPEELAEIMEFIIKNPSIINDLNKKIIENRSHIIKTMDDHFEEIKAVYCSLLNS